MDEPSTLLSIFSISIIFSKTNFVLSTFVRTEVSCSNNDGSKGVNLVFAPPGEGTMNAFALEEGVLVMMVAVASTRAVFLVFKIGLFFFVLVEDVYN